MPDLLGGPHQRGTGRAATDPAGGVSPEEKFIRKLERRKAKEAFVKQGKPWKEEQIRQRAANWFRHADALLERLDRNG
jgi:hypothetical protein